MKPVTCCFFPHNWPVTSPKCQLLKTLTLFMVSSNNIILPSSDHTFVNQCSSLAFSNILILFAVKLSIVTPIPFSFKTFLFFYIIFLVLYLTYFTIISRGLAFLDFFGIPSLCDLSISSGLIFWFISSSVTFIDNSLLSSPSTSSTQ